MTSTPSSLERNSSVLGRLLEELSWVGATIRNYRNGGQGYENILTAEAFQGLDFLPRRTFLGTVVAHAYGADVARVKLTQEIEDAYFTLLPGNQYLRVNSDIPKIAVQPDGIIESPSMYVILEAKRISNSIFQSEQLAREYVLALRDAKDRIPLLFLVLGSPPPVKVQRHGTLTIQEAISLYLPSVLDRTEGYRATPEEALSKIEEVVCWITWQEISSVVETQLAAVECSDPSIAAALRRLARSVTAAIAWHGS